MVTRLPDKPSRRPFWATATTIAVLLVIGAYVATPSLFSRIVLFPLVLTGRMPSPLDARDYRHQDEPSRMVVQYGMLALCAVIYSVVIQFVLAQINRRGAAKRS